MFIKSIQKIVNFFFVCLVAGCIGNTPKVVSVYTPTATSLSNNLTQPVSQETTPTPRTVEINTSGVSTIQYTCLNIATDDHQTTDIKGTLVLRNQGNSVEDNLLLLNLNSGEQKNLTPHFANIYSLSPKGTFLAYDSSDPNQEENGKQISVIDSNGDSVAVVSVKNEWDRFEWLDEGNLLINVPARNNPLIMLSPFTGRQSSIEPFAVEVQKPFDQELIYSWGFFAYHKIVYNNNFTRAIYALLESGEPRIAIRDIVSNKDLASYPSFDAWGVSPKWSPSGEFLAIALNTNSSFKTDDVRKYELLIINYDGSKLFSTDLSNSLKSLYISSLSWSPDSNYVAFWYTTENDIHHNLELAVLDVKTKEIINYCVTKNDETHPWKRNDISPIWSPDSTSLLIEVPDISDQTPNSVIVDILREKAVLVKPGLIPVGWMISP